MQEKNTVLIQYKQLYNKLVIILFPDSECAVSLEERRPADRNRKPTDPQYPLTISWKLGGIPLKSFCFHDLISRTVGSLGKATEAGFITKSKVLIRRVLAEAAEEFYKGSCSISMFEVC